ncbi:hypothetical protein BDW62DRAFT_201359 [Aspergillus aurantiobrunneus]
MHRLITTILAALASIAMAAPTTPNNPLPTLNTNTNTNTNTNRTKHSLPPTWEIAPTPDATPSTLTGTISELHAQLRALNPNYDSDWNDPEPQPQSQPSPDNGLALSPRSPDHDVDCWDHAVEWGVPVKGVKEGIETMRGFRGHPYLGAGPGECARITCSWNSAIWWCNDNLKPKRLPSFDNIADGAQVILDHCTDNRETVVGELNHADKWRVIVRPYYDC